MCVGWGGGFGLSDTPDPTKRMFVYISGLLFRTHLISSTSEQAAASSTASAAAGAISQGQPAFLIARPYIILQTTDSSQALQWLRMGSRWTVFDVFKRFLKYPAQVRQQDACDNTD